MKYIDLFAGVGGFRYGIDGAYQSKNEKLQTTDGKHLSNSDNLERTAPTCVYSNEWDKYANSVYRRHYGECDIRDIKTVKSSELPDFDLICGGFPCQSFSVAGKRGGFDDTRGTLFFEIARLASEKQPRLLLLENVKGLLNHDQGRTFRTILATLDELGYDAQWQVLNSKNFGVPQNRERVFIIGHLRGTPRPEVFPLTGSSGQTNSIGSEKPQIYLGQAQRVRSTRGVAQTLSGLGGGQGAKTGIYEIKPRKIRRLTPIECERLQGFPDNWTQYDADGKLVSDTQRYKMMGNAVTTNVVTAIVERLL